MAGKINVVLSATTGQFNAAMAGAAKRTRKSTRGIKGSLGGLTSSFSNLGGAAIGAQSSFGGIAGSLSGIASAAPAAAAGMALVGAAFASIKAASTLEGITVGFEVMTGSAETAAKTIANLRKLAEKTKFQSQDVILAGKALIQFGVAGEDLIGILRQIADVASASTSRSLSDITRIFGKIFAKGRVTMEEINQLTEAGTVTMKDFADQLGLTGPEFSKMVTAGKISSEQVLEVLKSLTDEGARFGGLADKLAGTLAGQWSNLTSVIQNTSAIIGKMITEAFGLKHIVGLARDAAEGFRNMMQANIVRAMTMSFKAMADTLAVGVAGIKASANALGELGGMLLNVGGSTEKTISGMATLELASIIYTEAINDTIAALTGLNNANRQLKIDPNKWDASTAAVKFYKDALDRTADGSLNLWKATQNFMRGFQGLPSLAEKAAAKVKKLAAAMQDLADALKRTKASEQNLIDKLLDPKGINDSPLKKLLQKLAKEFQIPEQKFGLPKNEIERLKNLVKALNNIGGLHPQLKPQTDALVADVNRKLGEGQRKRIKEARDAVKKEVDLRAKAAERMKRATGGPVQAALMDFKKSMKELQALAQPSKNDPVAALSGTEAVNAVGGLGKKLTDELAATLPTDGSLAETIANINTAAAKTLGEFKKNFDPRLGTKFFKGAVAELNKARKALVMDVLNQAAKAKLEELKRIGDVELQLAPQVLGSKEELQSRIQNERFEQVQLDLNRQILNQQVIANQKLNAIANNTSQNPNAFRKLNLVGP